MFQVAFVNYRGEWVMDSKTFKSEPRAAKHAKVVSKKSENGRVSVRRMKW